MTKVAVILASGEGSRLSSIVERYHKPLARLHGLPLIAYPLASLARAGCEEFVIVANMFNADKLRATIRGLGFHAQVVVNTRFGEAGASLIKALEYVNEDIILSMSDHIYLPEHVSKLRSCKAELCVAGDRSPTLVDIEEATKVQVVGNRVLRFSKSLATYDYVDTGVFYISSKTLNAIREVATCPECMSLNQIWNTMIDLGINIGVVDITGLPWMEVDNEADYYSAVSGAGRALLEKLFEVLLGK